MFKRNNKNIDIIIIIIIIKSFYSLWSLGRPWRASRHCDLQLFPWPHSMIFLFLLFHPLLSFATFSSAYLFFYIPGDSNLMLFSLLLLLLCVMCVQSNSIFFFLKNIDRFININRTTHISTLIYLGRCFTILFFNYITIYLIIFTHSF
jgi:hypothetical protein